MTFILSFIGDDCNDTTLEGQRRFAVLLFASGGSTPLADSKTLSQRYHANEIRTLNSASA